MKKDKTQKERKLYLNDPDVTIGENRYNIRIFGQRKAEPGILTQSKCKAQKSR